MSSILVTKTESGFSVKFPYELKDSFRELFPSAKWDSYAKSWNVGPRSGKRLEQWKAEVEKTADEIIAANEAKNEADLLQSEVHKLRMQLEQVTADIQNIETSRLITNSSKEMLAQLKDELNKANNRKITEEQALSNEKAEVTAMIASIIDLPAVKQASQIMAYNMVPADRSKKALFNEAQELAVKAKRQLREAGLSLDAVTWLAEANVNRPDRDHPRLMRSDAWYTIRKIQLDE